MKGYKTKRRIKVKINYADKVYPIISAVYFFINKKTNVVEYIGQSFNVYSRITNNYIFGYKPNKYKVRIIPCYHKVLRWYERRWLQKYRPIRNNFIPKIRYNYLHNPYSA